MPRILAFIADPLYGGASKRLHERWGWSDPFSGVAQAVEDLNVALGLGPGGSGDAYTLETVEIPLPAFGTRNPDRSLTHIDDINVGDPITLSPAEWVQKWETIGWNPAAWPGGGELHIRHFLQQHVLPRIGSCDEVWLAAMPMPMAFEGAMLAPTWDLAAPRLGAPDMGTGGPGGPTFGVPVPCTLSLPKGMEHDEVSLDRLKAYRTHDTLVNVPELTQRYVLHMFQASNFQPIHNFIHRCESVLSYLWDNTGWNGYGEQWGEPLSPMNLRSYVELFGMTENVSRGREPIAVGSGHFHCNSKIGYLYQMVDVVPSIAHMFKDFPNGFPIDLSTVNQRSKLVSARDWAHFRDAQMWWLSCLPRNPGKTDGRFNDWRIPVMNVNDETGRGEPMTRPVVGSLPMLPFPVTRYGNRALLRWEPDAADPGDVMYRLSVDGVDAGSLRRENQNHVRLSYGVPLGYDYRIKADYAGGRERIFNKGVPTPDGIPPVPVDPVPPPPPPPIPTPEPGETMLSLDEVRTEVLALHQTVLAGCQPPDKYEEEPMNIRLKWNAVVGESVPVIRFWTVEELRQNYPATYRNHWKLKTLCGSVPTPVPTPTPSIPEPDGGYPPRPATAAYSPQELWAAVSALHAPGGRMAGCPGPNRMTLTASADYVLWWDFLGGEQRTMNEQLTLDLAMGFYEGPLYAGLRRHCTGDVPVPVPEPPPVPPSALTLAQVKEAILGLYAPEGRYEACTPPDAWSEDAAAYRAHWAFEGNSAVISKPTVRLSEAQTKYIASYSIMPGRAALCAEEPPPPDEDPLPSTLSLRPLFEAEALAHEAAARTWRERMERLP